MGLNIHVYNSQGKYEPSWDSGRIWYDKQILSILGELEDQYKPDSCYHDLPPFRPKDLNKVRENIKNKDWEEEGKKRYYHLVDLIEQGCWIYISY